jgi:hypothetical protein
MRFMSQADLQALLSFLTTHCRPGSTNPLSILSAAQMVIDLPVDQAAALQRGLEGVSLESTLAQLIEHKAAAAI